MIDEDQVDDAGSKEEDPGAEGKHWRSVAETLSNEHDALPRQSCLYKVYYI